jgi:hypothetical protein
MANNGGDTLRLAQQWNNRAPLGGPPKQMTPKYGLKLGVPGTGVPSVTTPAGDIRPQLPGGGAVAALQQTNFWRWIVIGGVLIFLLQLAGGR